MGTPASSPSSRPTRSRRWCAPPTTPTPPPGRTRAPRGGRLLLHQRVRIVGLSARPQLNGRIGTVTTYDSRSGRYGIQLDDGDRRWAQNAWKKVACVAKARSSSPTLRREGGAGRQGAVGAADEPAPGSARARAGRGARIKAAELPADVLEAVCDGDTAAAELWLRRGGHVDGRGPEEEGWFRITLLMIAARGGHETTARLLLQHRASVDLQDSKGGTALMYSSFYGHEAIARLLLQHHAALDRQNALGRTPLMAACLKGHDAIVRLLLRAGARTDLRDTEHQLTALEFAEHKGNSARAWRRAQVAPRPRARADRSIACTSLDPDPPKGESPTRAIERWAAVGGDARVAAGRRRGCTGARRVGVGRRRRRRGARRRQPPDWRGLRRRGADVARRRRFVTCLITYIAPCARSHAPQPALELLGARRCALELGALLAAAALLGLQLPRARGQRARLLRHNPLEARALGVGRRRALVERHHRLGQLRPPGAAARIASARRCACRPATPSRRD